MWTLSVIKAMRDIQSRKDWTRDRILRHQRERLRDLIYWAWHHSPFYREYYSDHGITENQLPEITVEDLPIIRKEILMEHFDRLSRDPLIKRDKIERWIHSDAPLGRYSKDYVVMHTSGTAGTMGIFVHDRTSWTRFRATTAVRSQMKVRYNPLRPNRFAYYGATHGRFAGMTSVVTAPKLITSTLACSVLDPIDQTVRQLNQFQPEILAGYPSALADLAMKSIGGDLSIQPHYILSAGEVLTQTNAALIKKAFGFQPVDSYSSSECMNMALQRSDGPGLSLMEDECIVEILGDGNLPVDPGESGRVVLTNLNNRVMPIIRYDMRDMVTRGYRKDQEPFEPIQSIDGRANDALPIRSATGGRDTIHPLVLSEFFVPGIKKFQFIAKSPEEIVIRYNASEEMDAKVHQAFQKILQLKGAASTVKLSTSYVTELPVDEKTGKFRLVMVE
ncbi:MAG: phenylacetate--CoA ligase family protein [Verrucomicrobia bacterium]|nr:phenylacetate--CoA ligase family protein [Verrucomicrobiota bacterium]